MQTASLLLALVLCLAGIFISLVSFTGAWLIALASVLLVVMTASGSPGWPVALSFLAICVLLEVFDFFAGVWGVSRRGGSALAGWAALFGGLAGMVAGAIIPVPVVGSLIGLLAGSFVCAYAVEKHRLQHHDQAARIARGAVWARLGVMLAKTVAALGMTAYLCYALWV